MNKGSIENNSNFKEVVLGVKDLIVNIDIDKDRELLKKEILKKYEVQLTAIVEACMNEEQIKEEQIEEFMNERDYIFDYIKKDVTDFYENELKELLLEDAVEMALDGTEF